MLKITYILSALSVLMLIFISGLVVFISYDLPQLNSLSDYSPPIPSRVYSRDGHLLMELSKEKRDIATIEEIPKKIINAFLAAEDDNFYNHSGIDYFGILRAMLKNIKEGRIKQGASTITQQVAKSLLLTNERTFTRKIKDMILAKKIEEKLTKDEILYLYLNQVYLGGGYYGVKSAFRGYFDKELSEATIAETALVAGLLVAPGRYSPYVNPKKAKSRQKYVLGRLRDTNQISIDEYESAINEDIKIQIRKPVPLKAGYFTDWIRQRLVEHFGKDDFITSGYEVVTTLDWELQKKAEEEVLKGVRELDKRQGFKGPLSTIEDELKINEFLVKQRKKLYKEGSRFLIFKANGTSESEFSYKEGEFEDLIDFEKDQYTEVKSGRTFLEPGNIEASEVYEFLNFDKPVKAVVTKVSNTQRIIYASHGGVKLIIPHENFKWAHERALSEDRNYWSYVNNPEYILKRGDVILVSISNKTVGAWNYLYKDFKTSFSKNKSLVQAIKKQKYYLASLDQEAEAQGALLSVSPLTGEIISMVGGIDFARSQFNRVVQSNRQPGSAFKPMIFAVGLENFYTPATRLLDSPQALGGVNDALSWKPRNYDGKFKGSMTFRRALETSRNIPTIKLTQDVGVQKIINFVERVGVKADLPPDLSVSLGSFGMNLLDLVKMYSVFPNGGKKLALKSIISIKDRYGEIHQLNSKAKEEVKEVVKNLKAEDLKVEGNPEGDEAADDEKVEEENPYLVNLTTDQVYDERLAYIMSNLLRGVVQRGTGRNTSNISSYIGGKTGTTNNYVDAWFLGFSSKLVTGVWTGFDDNKTLGWPETGAKAALPIWREFMQAGIRKYGDPDFPTPSGIVNVAIDSKTGKLSTEETTRFIESFVEGTEPGGEEFAEGEDDVESSISILESDDYYSSQ
jgi:penicillin-binding protein 1A